MTNGQSSLRPTQPVACDRALEAVVEEFVSLLEDGGEPSIEQYVSRCPERAGELRRLLRAALALAQLGTPSHSAPQEHSSNSGVPTELQELGEYRLIREIGRGGMGIVYEAEQQSLRRRVALKVLPFASVLDQQRLQRFHIEAQAAASLDHPHIVRVYTVGQDRGVHYYTMQLISGQSLADVLLELRRRSGNAKAAVRQDSVPARANARKSGDIQQPSAPDTEVAETARTIPTAELTLPVGDAEYFQQVACWGIQAALALEHAHQLGIVHRDVKPSNLLIDPSRTLWITDFGLALTRADVHLTATGHLLGTLRYMSPEQTQPQPGRVDQRTDIYSLGMTLYELLTLQAGFPEREAANVLQKIARDDPAPPRLLRPEIPVELECIVGKAIQKDILARYATAQELADDLRRFLNDEPIVARPPTLREVTEKWLRRHRSLVRGISVGLLLCLATGLAAAVMIWQTRQQASLERLARQAEGQAAETGRRTLRTQQYIASVNLAYQAVLRGDLQEAGARLDDCRPNTSEEDLRGFDWCHLQRRLNRHVRELGRHAGRVYSIVRIPGTTCLASAGQDGIRIWDRTTDRLLHHLEAHGDEVNSLNASADGRWLASASDDTTVQIWNTRDWTTHQILSHTGPVGFCHFSANGRYLMTGEVRYEYGTAAAAAQNLVRVWDTQDWTVVTEIGGYPHQLSAGEIADDGTMVTGDTAGMVTLRTLPDGALLRSFDHFPAAPDWADGVNTLDCAHRHPWIVTGGWERAIHLWNSATTAPLGPLRTALHKLRSVSFAPDDRLLVTAGYLGDGGSIHVWRLAGDDTYHEVASLVSSIEVWDASVVSEDEVAYGDGAGGVSIWNPVATSERRWQSQRPDLVWRAAISPDNRWLAVSGSGIVVHSLQGLGTATVLSQQSQGETPLTFSHDGEQLIAATGDTCPRWRTNSWQRLPSLSSTPGPIIQLHLQDAGTRLCAELPEGDPRWHWFALPSGDKVTDPRIHRPTILGPNGWHAVETSPEGWQILQHERWLPKRNFPRHTILQFAGDGSRLAVGKLDGTIELCDSETGKTIALCVGSGRDPIAGIAYSPNGKLVASHNQPRHQITLWNAATGRELYTLTPGFRSIRTFAFSADGTRLLIAGQNVAGHGEALLLDGSPER